MSDHFNKEAYFDSVRESLFNGSMSQQQVQGQNFILREWRKRYDFGGDHRHLAYMLATTFKETGRTMYPITEYGSQTYLTSKPYYPYIGRGFVQLTWEENYLKASPIVEEDLVEYPDLALQPDIAAIIMYDGMEVGWFTGVALGDYFNNTKDDPYNARKIINGLDCAGEIAGYHEEFLSAITAASA
jgi:predicted chitinase